MLFNSVHFLLFFPLVVGIYFALSHRFRWILLLAASYYFYMCWKPEYVILIIASTLIDYYAARRMARCPARKSRRLYLILSLVSNLGLLFAFKYFNFFSESARVLFGQINIFYDAPVFQVLLPVGISFYTFQTLSYTIDVYRGKKQPESHLGIFALYVAFFPQLVAGPIERSTRLLPQLRKRHDFDYTRVTDGLKLMLWGFFKKVVIADRVAVVVNQVYNNPQSYEGTAIIIATYLFAFQIFCDFSGYSDIAIGAARVMGYDLMKNFNRPYHAGSISDFWKRWHISLSTWFRDYLYFPLGGNRVAKSRWYTNLLVVFLISGLWHGAAWTFVIWGALHGVYLISSIVTAPARRKLYRLVHLDPGSTLVRIWQTVFTFHLVCFAWIFFRANSLSDAMYLIGHMFSNIRLSLTGHNLGLAHKEVLIAGASILVMEIVHLIQTKYDLHTLISSKPIALRWVIYYALAGSIIFLGAFNISNQFIYFQF